jgi:hypothetical protein
MIFGGLLFRFALGYLCGLLAGPFLRRRFSKFGDVSIRGGIAGALGASVPYLLLNSIFATRMPLVFIGHENWVGAIASLLAIAGVEIIAGLNPRFESPTTPADRAAAALASKRKAAIWLWLCVPALVYRLWRFFLGESTANPWTAYTIGALAFLGLVGYVVVCSVSFLRATKYLPIIPG